MSTLESNIASLETKLRLSVLSTDPVIKKCLSNNTEKLKFALLSARECDTWLTRREMGLLCSLSYSSVCHAMSWLQKRGHDYDVRLRRVNGRHRTYQMEYRIVDVKKN